MTEPLLVAHQLARSFGKTRALEGLDLELRSGEIYGLVGPDGAGKTTTLRLLSGVLRPTSGEVRVLGRLPYEDGARAQLGYMPQHYSLYGELTVAENLRFFASLFGLGRSEFRARQERLLRLTRLEPFLERRADALSGGMYKKLALACVLLHQPRVLLLDEPTNGVDPLSRREFWQLLGTLAEAGAAVMLSTPYLDEAARCHRVGLLHGGRLLAEGNPEELKARSGPPVYWARGDRKALSSLESDPRVLASTPSGTRIRLVVESNSRTEVEERARELGVGLEPTRPDFEDLFLVLLARPAHAKSTVEARQPELQNQAHPVRGGR